MTKIDRSPTWRRASTIGGAMIWLMILPMMVSETFAGRARRDEAGEGVISAAIAVLIMAFLGVGLWLAFSKILNTTTTNVANTMSKIGN